MTYDSQELLALFGRLIQNRPFTAAAMRASLPDDNPRGQRGQLRLLRLLGEKDGLTNAEIAEALDIRPSSVSALVKKLEDAHFITRHDDPDDKRVSRIFVTADGRTFIKGARQFRDDFSEACFAALSPDEQHQLHDLIQKLLTGLDRDESPWRDLSRQARDFRHQFEHFHGHAFGGNPFWDHR